MNKFFYLLSFLFIISCSQNQAENLPKASEEQYSTALPIPKYKVLKFYNHDEYVFTNIITNPAARYLIVMTISDYFIYKKLIRMASNYSIYFYSNKTKENLRKSLLADSNEINFYKNSIIKIGVRTNAGILLDWEPGSYIYKRDLK